MSFIFKIKFVIRKMHLIPLMFEDQQISKVYFQRKLHFFVKGKIYRFAAEIIIANKLTNLKHFPRREKTRKTVDWFTYPDQHVIRVRRIQFLDGDKNSIVSRLLHPDGHLHHYHHNYYHHHHHDWTSWLFLRKSFSDLKDNSGCFWNNLELKAQL